MNAACSWSGGKDSALALDLAIEAGATPRALVTMLTEAGGRSRSHGLALPVLQAQAAALGVPLLTRATSWAGYTEAFVQELAGLAGDAITQCVFGDIDIDDHRRWCQRACLDAGLVAHHPLWQRPRRELLDELFGRGWRATVVTVRDDVLDRSLLGRELDPGLVDELEAAGVDACGEQGEYHTVVTEGPLLATPLRLIHGEQVLRSGCWFLDVGLK